jgi:tripartite-type tricarboxylate transporter receptor subunit TctC
LPLIKAGRLRVLATTGARRSAQMPDVPTLEEAAGLADVEIVSPVWTFAPKGAPAAVIAKLSEAIGAIVATPEFKAFCSEQSLEPDYQPAADARAQATAELARWRRLVQLARA